VPAIAPVPVIVGLVKVLLVNVCAVERSTVVVVFILNAVPVNVKPLPAVYVPAPEN